MYSLISQAINAIDEDSSQGDAKCKRLLGHALILAHKLRDGQQVGKR